MTWGFRKCVVNCFHTPLGLPGYICLEMSWGLWRTWGPPRSLWPLQHLLPRPLPWPSPSSWIPAPPALEVEGRRRSGGWPSCLNRNRLYREDSEAWLQVLKAVFPKIQGVENEHQVFPLNSCSRRLQVEGEAVFASREISFFPYLLLPRGIRLCL